MDGGNKERFAINFLFKAGPYATEIGAKGFWEWGSEPIKIFMRYSGFRDGREMVENDERGGPPKSTRIEVNNAAVANLVKNGRRIASRMVAESLNIHKTVGLWILKEDLGKRKMCICFVSLLDTWGKGRSSHILPRLYRNGQCRNFFWQNYYGRRNLVFCLWPWNKATGSEWVCGKSIRPKRLKFQRSLIKTMLIV